MPDGEWAPERVSVERSIETLAGTRFVTTTTRKVYPFAADPEIAQLELEQWASNETIVVSQIDAPADGSQRAWNAFIVKRTPELLRSSYEGANSPLKAGPDRQVSVKVAAQVVAVAPGIIAARLHSYTFPNGFIHAWETDHAFLWSTKEGRALTAEDLFDPATSWWTKLAPSMLRAIYGEPTDPMPDYDRLERLQTPRLLREGICLKFKEEGTGADPRWRPIFLYWRTVRPFLRKPLPFDPEQLEFGGAGWDDCSASDAWGVDAETEAKAKAN